MTINSTEKMSWKEANGQHYTACIAAKIPGYRLLHEQMAFMMHAHLTGEDHKLLIVGAGGGQEIISLGQLNQSWHFTGIDPSESMLAEASLRLKEAGILEQTTLLQGTVTDLPQFIQYDGATCMLVLHFIQDEQTKLKMLQEIASRLKSGAMFIMATLSADPSSKIYPILMSAYRSSMLSAGISEEHWEKFQASIGHTSYPEPSKQIVKWLELAGFEHVTRYFGSYMVEGYVAIKK
jgi:tRNA (cmo5U34)-methyltransferase